MSQGINPSFVKTDNYKIFVVFHKHLCEEFYSGDEDRYLFCKVGDQPITELQNNKIKERILEHTSLKGYTPLGKHWAESEFLFSLYNSILANDPLLPNNLEWIGITQYDHTCDSNGIKIVDHIDRFLSSKRSKDDVIAFAPFDMAYEIHTNKIAMDYNNPNKLQGDPSCYFPMIADYNKYYSQEPKKNYGDLIRSKTIPLCSSFFIHKDVFMDMMEFCSWVIKYRDLNFYDTERVFRLAGGYMERYYGMWFILRGLNVKNFPVGCKK